MNTKQVDTKLVIECYDEGFSIDQIARMFGVSSPTIRNRILQSGNKIKYRGRNQGKGQLSHRWKGGINANGEGYNMIYVPSDHWLFPYANKHSSGKVRYMMQHRFVMAEHLNRPLKDWETVHHINGDKTDNRLGNLQIRVGKHGKGIAIKCSDCGSNKFEYEELR